LKKLSRMALLTAVAMLLSWLEGLFLPSLVVPGVKFGLANIVTLVALSLFTWKEAILISVSRVVLSAFLFGNLFSMLYALAGAVVSLCGMALLLRTERFSLFGVSAAGGFLHNLAELAVAAVAVQTPGLVSYLPVLTVAGTVTGLINALLAKIVLTRLRGV